jgi:hypothetical protein
VFPAFYVIGLGLMLAFTDHQARKLSSDKYDFNYGLAKRVNKYSLDLLVTRCVQISLFMIAQSSSRMITNAHRWQDEHYRNWCIAWSIAYVVLLLLLRFGIADSSARRFGLCSMGEFADRTNLEAVQFLVGKHLHGLTNKELADLYVTETDLHSVHTHRCASCTSKKHLLRATSTASMPSGGHSSKSINRENFVTV